jgi:hypothetical protein
MSIKGGNMKVIESEEGYLKFDNGLILESDHDQDCCEINYLDFEEQLPVGTELPTMTAKEFAEAIKIGDDGFSIKDIHDIPKWVQARSEQNGYYSFGVDLIIRDDIDEIIPKRPNQRKGQELFCDW